MSRIPSNIEPTIVENAPLPLRPADAPATFILPDQMQWKKLVPAMGERSPRLSVVRHDIQTGATTMLIWTPPNFHVPRHWHAGSEKHMVVRGTFIIEAEGKKVVMPQGTFNYLPARTIHQAWTPSDSDCLLFTDVDTAWDINWLDSAP